MMKVARPNRNLSRSLCDTRLPTVLSAMYPAIAHVAPVRGLHVAKRLMTPARASTTPAIPRSTRAAPALTNRISPGSWAAKDPAQTCYPHGAPSASCGGDPEGPNKPVERTSSRTDVGRGHGGSPFVS